ncbi:MAG: thymidine phosphorylase [Pseudomonadota bacterium]|nr:thymidine phosphorylase [Pseudomonadota bacterium]
MLPQEIIRNKRDGKALTSAEIDDFIQGMATGSVSEGQVAAFAMAVVLNGTDMAERVALTRAMTVSGTVLNWSGLDGPVLDKHSSGGIGDKVSLILAPVVAACGGYVPMISGRGLGHTGGTLDKMDAIPGYVSQPDLTALRRTVTETGCAIIGATADLAPADKTIYAIRDVTATVESLGLITASILSKKLAAGLDALVMDIKTGSGAFCADFDTALELAESIVTVGNGAGMKTTALITDMNEPLGRTAGNALEVLEVALVLTGGPADSRLLEVTRELVAELLVMGNLADDIAAARVRFDDVLASGAAAERFAHMVKMSGGPDDFLERADAYLPKAKIIRPFVPTRTGFVTAIDTRAVGMAIVEMGGGRTRPTDTIDHAVGLSDIRGIGCTVGPDAPFCMVHASDEASAKTALARLETAVTTGDTAPARSKPIKRRIAVD